MKIKEGMFVLIVTIKEFGRIEKINDQDSSLEIDTISKGLFTCRKDQIIILAENCKSPIDGWQKNQPEIIKNLTVAIHASLQQVKSLQKQANELEGKIDSVNTGLVTTQKDLREHFFRPHPKE